MCLLMPEVSQSRKDHSYPVLVSGLNSFSVPERTTGLNNCRNSGLSCRVDSVAKRKKSVGCQAGTFGLFTGFFDADSNGIHTAHLPCANPQRLPLTGDNDGIGFDVLDDAEGESEI